jgi:hypothetical protein
MSRHQGQGFTLSHFVAFFFRFSLIHFNYTSEMPENYNNAKKVLHMLRNLEVSDSFMRFLSKTNRPYNGQLSFLPGKKLLGDLLRNEGYELSMDLGPNYNTTYTKEELISAILNGTQTLPLPQPDFMFKSDSMFSMNEAPLKKVFQNYCQFGEQLNT